MQVKIFTIPLPGSDGLTEEMNVFLRSRKVLQVENHLVQQSQGAFLIFCIKYLDGFPSEMPKPRVDYREVLDEASFKRFSGFREIRKQLALKEAIPAYAIFTDEEMAGMAKLESLTPASIKTIKGIGEKKSEKYASFFMTSQPPTAHAPSQPSA